MSVRRFRVTVIREVVIDVDEDLTPDDEWRSVFYNCQTLGEMAEHIVHNLVTRQFKTVEGLLPEELKEKVKMIDNEFYLEYGHVDMGT